MALAISDPSMHAAPSLAYPPGPIHQGHVVQLYTDDGFLADVLSRFISEALAVGNAAVVIATKAHRTQLQERLSACGFDATTAAMQRRYVVLDAAETLSKFVSNGSVDEKRFKNMFSEVLTQVRSTLDGKERSIAVFGELVALLWAEGKPQAAIQVEQFWNDLAKSHSLSLFCAYPITGFDNEKQIEPFLKMCGQHSGVLPSESYLGLGSEEERLRRIAQLEQKARALENELALRQSEERFRLIIEAVQDYAIFMLDPEGNVSSWNVGAERIKGYKPEEILGKHFSCFYPEKDVRLGKPKWALAATLEKGRHEDEGWRLRKNGSRFWASVTITALRDASGQLLGFAKVTRDFTERIQAQQILEKEVAERRDAQRRLQGSEKSLRKLSLHLLRTQDEERRRIGRDLHDTLGQVLAVLKMKLDSVASLIGEENGSAAQDLAQCIGLAEDSIQEVRTVSYLLYPPMLEEMGLKSAIPWYLDGFSERSGIETTFDVSADFGRLPRDSELALFRVLQESLTNVHRHSGSRIAHVRLSIKEGTGILEIEDNGMGIPSQFLEQFTEEWMSAPGIGLRGMKERMQQLGGSLGLVSAKSGTTVCAIVPMEITSSAR